MAMAGNYVLNIAGDVMLGRLIDQLMPTHVNVPEEAAIVQDMRKRNAKLRRYTQEQVWGNTLPIFRGADLNLINLETSITTNAQKWPNKTFNYQMHPSNIEVLKLAHISYVSLANNHTLDFEEAGLKETIESVRAAGIASAGAGVDSVDAQRPATLYLSDPSDGERYTVKVFAASDHPLDWRCAMGFHLIDYNDATRQRLKEAIAAASGDASLRIFSVHWGPNYSWQPAAHIQRLAHFLVDECGIDIVHGHSSHHLQGIEVRNGSLILYGCGDFVDDYALVAGYRNDLGALWQVTLGKSEKLLTSTNERIRKPLRLKRLEVLPSRIRDFQVNFLHESDPDHDFVCGTITRLSAAFGTSAREERGREGQLIFEIA